MYVLKQCKSIRVPVYLRLNHVRIKLQNYTLVFRHTLICLFFFFLQYLNITMACTDFLKGRGEKKGTLACVLVPKRAVYHVLTSQGAVQCVLPTKRAL